MSGPLAVALVIATVAFGLVFTPSASAAPGDSTAALQAKFDALSPGGTLSGVIVIRVPNVQINGNGATLQATNDATSSVQIKAEGVSYACR
jgi:hypothetical protein